MEEASQAELEWILVAIIIPLIVVIVWELCVIFKPSKKKETEKERCGKRGQ